MLVSAWVLRKLPPRADAARAAFPPPRRVAGRSAQVRPMPGQEKQVMMLAPSERHAMPAREIVKTTLIVQRNGLPDRPPEISKFLDAQ